MKLNLLGKCAGLVLVFSQTLPALSANYYWNGAGDGVSWNDKQNWTGPGGNGDTYPGMNNKGVLTTTDQAIFPASCVAEVTMDQEYMCSVSLGYATDATITLHGCGVSQKLKGGTLATGLSLTLDNISLGTTSNITIPSDVSIRLENGAVFGGWSGTTKYALTLSNGTSLEVVDSTLIGSSLTVNSSVEKPTSVLFSGATTVYAPTGAFKNSGTATTVTLTDGVYVKFPSTFVCGSGATSAMNLTVSDGAKLHVTGDFTSYIKTSIVIDDATIQADAAFITMNPSGSLGGDTITFKGKNPRLSVGTKFCSQDNNHLPGYYLNFEVPVGGYKEVPITYLSATTPFMSHNFKGPAHFRVLSTSPALTNSTGFTTKLMTTPAGIKRIYNSADLVDFGGMDTTLVTADNFALKYNDGKSIATTDAEAQEVWFTWGKIEEEDNSTGVSAGMTASADRRAVKVSGTINHLSVKHDTKLSLLVGASQDESTMTVVTNFTPTAEGAFSFVWQAPEYTTYVLRLRLETLDGETVLYTENSPYASVVTPDATTYTWQAVGGVWDGAWSDPSHWSNNAPGGDCTGYPNSGYATAVFPSAGAGYRVTLDATYRTAGVTANANGLDLTLANDPAASQRNVLTVNNAVNKTQGKFDLTGTGAARVTLDGVGVSFNWQTRPGKGKVVRLTNGASWYSDQCFTCAAGGTEVFVGDGCSFQCDDLHLAADEMFVVSNGTFSCRYVAFDSATATPAVVRLQGETPSFKVTQYIATGTKDASVTFDFELPSGGYATAPIFTENTNTNRLFNRSQAGGFAMKVSGSNVRRATTSVDCPLVSWPAGVETDRLTLALEPWMTQRGNAFLYADVSAAPFVWKPTADFVGVPKAVGYRLRQKPGLSVIVR